MTIQDQETKRIDSRLRELVGNERGVLVDFLKMLDAFDARSGWASLQYGGLWEYCRYELGYREGCTSKRINAMKVLRKFPQVEAYLLDGRLCFTALLMMKDVVDDTNADRVFEATAGRSTREIERFVAEAKGPKKEPTTYLRRLPAQKDPINAKAVLGFDSELPITSGHSAAGGAPGGEFAGPPASVPAPGQKCGSRWQTQVDHIIPDAMGGESTVENCRVLCRKHNLLHARRCFGAEKIDGYLRGKLAR